MQPLIPNVKGIEKSPARQMQDQLGAAGPRMLKLIFLSDAEMTRLGDSSIDLIADSARFKIFVAMDHYTFECGGDYVFVDEGLGHSQRSRLISVHSPVGRDEEKARFRLQPVAPVVVQ